MTRSEIIAALESLDQRLAVAGQSFQIFIAGGAAMALRFGVRESTKDIDAVSIAPKDLASFQQAAESVARGAGLPFDWTNENAARFAFGLTDGGVVFLVLFLVVHLISPERLLAMKLYGLRDQVHYEDFLALVRSIDGDRESVWRLVSTQLMPGMETWRRQNFDAVWEAIHESDATR